MTTKEKLELVWKYLALGVVVDAASFEDSEHGMKWLSEDGEVHLFKMDGNKREKKKVIKKMMKKKEHNR